MSSEQKNEGEGNRTAARRYRKKTEEFVESGKVEKKAEEAHEALLSEQGDKLREAERKGKGKAGEST